MRARRRSPAQRRAAALLTALTALLLLGSGTATAAPTEPTTTDTPEGLLAPFTLTDPHGVPYDHYDITADTGGWQDWHLKLNLWLSDSVMATNRTIVGGALWLLDWAFRFEVASLITEPAHTVGQTYQTEVIDRLGLPAFFLLLGAAWCGVQMMRGRVAMGAGELAVTLLISALATTVLAHPADVLLGEDGMLMHTRDTAMALTSVTVTQGASVSSDPQQAAQPLTDALTDVLIVQPHQALNYGEVLDETHPCWDTYRQVVQDGPWGDDDTPRDMMNDAGCEDLAEYNASPTMDRLLGTVLLLAASLIVNLLLLILVCVLLIAVIAMGIYVVLCPLVLVAALLPGGGRQLLWRWIGGVVKTLLAIIAICVFIAIFTVIIGAFMDASTDLPLVARFALVDLVALGGLIGHRKLINAGNRASQRLSRRLETARLGGTRGPGWLGPARGTPGLSPISATGALRDARTEFNRVADPVRRVSAAATKAWKGHPRAGKPAPPGAGRLHQRLSQSRGGRLALGTAKAASMIGKVALGSTIGAPIALPKATAVVKTAAKARSAATKTKLARHVVSATRTGKQLTNAWKQTAPARAVRTALEDDRDATRTRDALRQRHAQRTRYDHDFGNPPRQGAGNPETDLDNLTGPPLADDQLVAMDGNHGNRRLRGQIRAHLKRRQETDRRSDRR
ncbi:type IV secretion system protein [Nocardiopsis sp. CNT312]|uniref:type IV secretion system protein n=1 Tax=Nocardiopsis sp. CNT312 TaxID=1137268 RepID=UPI000490A215|nr:type IV secretion system protein [Nocardiopsis sp. CNT312]